MALKFNDYLIETGFAEAYKNLTPSAINIRLYPTSVAYPTTTTTLSSLTGYICAYPNITMSRTNGRIFMSSTSPSAVPTANGTIGWALVYNNAYGTFFVTDSVSASDPNSIIQLNTLTASTGSALILNSFSYAFGGI